LNLYAYVKNNPLKYRDPSGHSPQTPDEDVHVDPKSLEFLGPPPPPYEHMHVKVTVKEVGIVDEGTPSHTQSVGNRLFFGFIKGTAMWLNQADHLNTKYKEFVNTPEGQITAALLLMTPMAEESVSVEMEAAMDVELDVLMEGTLYRNGALTETNFTPRPHDAGTGLSTFDTLEAATAPGGKAQAIDVGRLEKIKAVPNGPPGHFGIVPKDATRMAEWISTRGTVAVHEFTVEAMKAVKGEVRRPK
jgi:hypothetical protein